MQKKKPEMQDIINDIKIMKYIRDINIIKNESILYKSNVSQLSKISQNRKYYNLLKLIRNQFIYENFQNKKYNDKLTIKSLKKLDLKLYEKICSFDNIIVVDTPKYTTYEILNGFINMTSNVVSDYIITNKMDTIIIIKGNQNKLIYLYVITDSRLRCKNIDSRSYLSLIRKEKLMQLKEKEDI